MTSVDLWCASCTGNDEPDPDRAILDGALRAAGLSCAWPAWNDPDVDWGAAKLCYPRATWDYHLDPDGFAAWVDDVATKCLFRNPAQVVRWNLHKAYLLDLVAAGIAVVPTSVVRVGERVSLEDVRAARGWSDVVIKPAISCASWNTHRFVAGEHGEETWSALLAERDMLVQPFVPTVETTGERSIIVIDGAITHVVRKEPRFAGQSETITGPLEPTPVERELVSRTLAAVDADLDYARVDVVANASGEPMIAELELIEPSLYFEFSDVALQRFVTMAQRHIQQS